MLDEAAERGDAARLAPGFALLAGLTYGLIVLGALVRAHGAGLACPDWPLCFGQWVPEMNLRVAFEYSHRVVAGSVALLFLGLATAAWWRTSPHDRLRRVLLLGGVLLVVQVLLGALTVWHLLASWTVTSHLLVGNAIAASFAWIALELRDRRRGMPPGPALPRSTRRLLALVLSLLVVQVALGGLVSSRYAGLACPEWPTCNGGHWWPSGRGAVGLHLLHRANGYLLLLSLTLFAARSRGRGRLSGLALGACALAIAQVVVGVANVLSGLPVEITGLHSALAAALVLTVTASAREAWGRAPS